MNIHEGKGLTARQNRENKDLKGKWLFSAGKDRLPCIS